MRTLIAFEEALAEVLSAATKLPSETVQLARSLGRTVAEDVVSDESLPPFANSAMDGFAVHTEDVESPPVSLRIVGEVPAGTVFGGDIPGGTCVRIMTGAPVPECTDAIVPVEKTSTESQDTVLIHEIPRKNAHIRPAGADIRAGHVVIDSGAKVTPGVVGMLASLGYDRPAVIRRPDISVISTGSEIVAVSEKPGPGQIRNSNAPALAALVRSAGGISSCVAHATDRIEAIQEVVEEGMNADAIVISGGVSMGDYDFVRRVLDEMGTEWKFWKVRQRPGKPLAFGTLRGKPVVGLPGNPVSSAICFEVYVRPLISAMLGRKEAFRRRLPAVLAHPLKKVKGLHHFSRGIITETTLESGLIVSTTGPQGSNLQSSVVRADCIIHLSEDMEDPPAGTNLWIELLD
jgi:molybdopterin molybdotransferase